MGCKKQGSVGRPLGCDPVFKFFQRHDFSLIIYNHTEYLNFFISYLIALALVGCEDHLGGQPTKLGMVGHLLGPHNLAVDEDNTFKYAERIISLCKTDFSHFAWNGTDLGLVSPKVATQEVVWNEYVGTTSNYVETTSRYVDLTILKNRKTPKSEARGQKSSACPPPPAFPPTLFLSFSALHFCRRKAPHIRPREHHFSSENL